ncbi:bacteriocin fulvocin C-related protein [Pedobacter sp.]|uniref:bacteriocin fulvocin C-related protein n=1 Tax=Pedobacter sp. TaxID=1411316 RepID=UPI003BA87195
MNKKIWIILQLSVFILFASCKKNSDQTINDSDALFKSKSKIDNVISLSSSEERRLAYKLLSSDEKSSFWLNQINNFKTTNKLTSSQIDIIAELDSIVKETGFNLLDIKSLTTKRDKWLTNAMKAFTNEQIRAIAFNIGNSSAPVTTLAAKDCNCNMNSWFTCDDRSVCPNTSATCKSDAEGCGFLGQYPCDNRCSYW